MSLTIKEQVALTAAFLILEEKWAESHSRRNLRFYREVFYVRYGLQEGDSKPATMQQVGEQFGFSRERVRQIEVRLLYGLRATKLPEIIPVLDKLEQSVKGLKKGRPVRARI